MLNLTHGNFNFFYGHRTLFKGSLQPSAKLIFVKRFSAAIGFYHPRHYQLSLLVSSKTFTAIHAFAAATNLPAIGDQSRVYNLGVISITKRAVHRSAPKIWALILSQDGRFKAIRISHFLGPRGGPLLA
jgi:hypothetical protein